MDVEVAYVESQGLADAQARGPKQAEDRRGGDGTIAVRGSQSCRGGQEHTEFRFGQYSRLAPAHVYRRLGRTGRQIHHRRAVALRMGQRLPQHGDHIVTAAWREMALRLQVVHQCRRRERNFDMLMHVAIKLQQYFLLRPVVAAHSPLERHESAEAWRQPTSQTLGLPHDRTSGHSSETSRKRA